MTNDQKIKKLARHQETIEKLAAELKMEVDELIALHQETKLPEPKEPPVRRSRAGKKPPVEEKTVNQYRQDQ